MNFGKYNRIDSLTKLKYLNLFLMDGDNSKFQIAAYDTETNGLRPQVNVMVGFSISVDSKKGFYIPLLDWIPNKNIKKSRSYKKEKYPETYPEGCFQCVLTGKQYKEDVTSEEYKPPKLIVNFLKSWLSKIKLIMHNAPFDVNMTYYNFGIDLKDQVFMDTQLLAHIINENSPNSLKKVAEEWRAELGINPYALANQEQQELHKSIIINGGAKPGIVWRADPEIMSKYACADTFLTFGVFEVGIKKFIEEFGEEKLSWLFEEEVIPLCREVVIPMKRKGVYIDVPYFKDLHDKTHTKMLELEDLIMDEINPFLHDFDKGKSIDEAISKQRLVKSIIELEGLTIPTKIDKKSGVEKESLAKAVVEKEYKKSPHWIWGYILGEDEIKYSDSKLLNLKKKLYEEVEGRRYRFNIGSDAHLTWLFCDKLGMDKKYLPQTDSATKDNPIPSMRAEVLKEYMLPRYPWVKILLKHKKLSKMYSSYLKPAINLNIDGWLYMDMKQNGTVSGRFSCSGGFNLQTLPRAEGEECPNCESKNVKIIQSDIELLASIKCPDCGFEEEESIRPSAIKKGFIAPPGYEIVNADYSSLEPRCFAYCSGDIKLKEVYWKNLDLYSKVFCDLFDKEGKYSADPKSENFLKKLSPASRTMIKPVVLGIPYGEKPYQIAKLIGAMKLDAKGREVPDFNRGKEIYDSYLNAYPDLRKYMVDREVECIEQGYVTSLVGRRRHFQYAPYVSKYIINKHLTKNDESSIKTRYDNMLMFIELKPSDLSKGSTLEVVHRETGRVFNLVKEDLVEFARVFKFRYPEVAEKGYWSYVRSLIKNEINNAKNFPIQALAGHMTNKGMLQTTRFINMTGVDAWVCLQVHDEITVYAKKEVAEDTSIMLKSGMEENSYTKLIDIPMIADPIICDNLKESK